MYILVDGLIKPASRTFVFGEVKSTGEAIAPIVEGQRAGKGEDDQNGDNGDMDGMTSGGSINSMRVEAALLAGKSQRMHYSRIK